MRYRPMSSRISEKVRNVKQKLPHCKDSAMLRHLAKAEVEADIWREISNDLQSTEQNTLECISKNFKKIKSDVYIEFRNAGEKSAKQLLKDWLESNGWAEDVEIR